MRLSRMLVVPILFVSMVVPAAAQEAVAVSRYRLSVAVASGAAASAVDLTPFEERCADDDGCEITLTGRSPSFLGGATNVRLFVSSSTWVADGVYGANSNTFANTVLSVHAAVTGDCELSDADDLEGNDDTDAFTVKTSGISPLTCTLTVID